MLEKVLSFVCSLVGAASGLGHGGYGLSYQIDKSVLKFSNHE
jgi:hypothetical protein